MDVLEAIKSRRSIKKFRPDPVERDKIEKVIEAGLWAPSGQNQQPCRFIVISDKELLDEVEAELYRVCSVVKKLRPVAALLRPELRGEKGKRAVKSIRERAFHGAPVLIMIGAMKDSSSTYHKDSAMAAQNMMLAAHALGLGSCYMGWIGALNQSAAMKKKLGIPPGFEITGGIVLGYGDVTPKPPPRKTIEETTTWH